MLARWLRKDRGSGPMIDLNDVLRVVAEWSGPDGSIAQLVWHYVVDAGNDEDPDDVLADIITNFETAWANIRRFP